MQMQPNAQQEMQHNMAPGDELLYVQFYMGAVPNKEQSDAEGHPMFDSMPFIKIMVPGDKNTVVDTAVTPQHKRRFAKMWQQFEANETQAVQGMPIREWPAITRGQADELYFLNIVTVEQLSTLADVYGSRIMGFNDLKRKALAFLENAKDSAYAVRVSEENAALKSQVTNLTDELARLSARFEASERAKSNGS